PMVCTIGGILRGILADGTPVHAGMKAGDIDPRCEPNHCLCASDKALAIGGGVLEAILQLTGAMRHG
ncbi:MAG: molybdenum hydroxylase, partial [Oscillospiraceae bacterium]|nr:molybdenum hydroxylase [Oscillospiraceae bacterium]